MGKKSFSIQVANSLVLLKFLSISNRARILSDLSDAMCQTTQQPKKGEKIARISIKWPACVCVWPMRIYGAF